ncbi:helix-turn-helix domain-containing protein [Actinoplanes derwentensis]|uniref:Helix-turn-helix domain-containing protein n=1 Tax=Actinoplanes derwentensis TaxID=113562 RepID=A0A1H2CVZ0_9ACTN|nr:helix-turn-helix transcriptional regulator [Actinoplanes derwentensis]GID82070.1 hypothetical protein Ade03nite_09940 [Actinoplanes derwentensis]SDT74544.1 Helix-turn-helix domain-containing protein [Actinoplanes derwentensis]
MDAATPLVAQTHAVWVSAELRQAVHDEKPGTVLRLARQAAGLTLEELGRVYGSSASTLSRIERGQHPIDQVEVRRRLACLLGVPAEFVGLSSTGGRHAAPTAQPDPDPASLRKEDGDPMRRRTFLAGAGAAALTTVASSSLPATAAEQGQPRLDQLLISTHLPAEPLTIDQATASVRAADRAYRDARYSIVIAGLPALIAGLHATAAASTGQIRDRVTALLSHAYQVASSAATKHGDDAIALTMADRGRTAAVSSGDQAAITAATHVLAITMRRDGHHTAALDLLTGTAEQLDILHATPVPVTLAAYGNLMCTAAYTAAQAGNPGAADTYIREAGAAADQLDNHPPAGLIPFTATTVAMYRISVHTTLGETGTALQHAASINPALLPTPERHGRYLVDTARAWSAHGRADKAAHAVLAAYRHAPQEVDRTSVRDLVTTLLHSPTPTPAALRNLATRIGVH